MQVNRRYLFASGREVENFPAVSRPVVAESLSPSSWFRHSHPLASVAAELCTLAGHPAAVRRDVIACGSCWERAIRADERFVSECGLPGEVTADAVGVDEIAVERACAGDRSVVLTRHEVWAAVERLRQRGLTGGQIATRLRRDHAVVRQILAGLAEQKTAQLTRQPITRSARGRVA